MSEIKTGADIANEITSYEAMHEPSLNAKEYIDLVGASWVSLSWLKEEIQKQKYPGRNTEQTDTHLAFNIALDWVLSILEES
jgi:hypothetical protein